MENWFPFNSIVSLQNFAHATTAQLSYHVQILIAITYIQIRWEQNEFSIEFELRWKNCSWNGPLDKYKMAVIAYN